MKSILRIALFAAGLFLLTLSAALLFLMGFQVVYDFCTKEPPRVVSQEEKALIRYHGNRTYILRIGIAICIS